MQKRTVRDALGEVTIPPGALWGAATQRAVANFPISGLRMPAEMIAAIALVKREAAATNADLGLLDRPRAQAIAAAAGEVIRGEHADQFPVDVFQTGSATSTNMNVNEVIATLASRALGQPVHPNDHVNRGQSSNDVIPTAMQVAACLAIRDRLLPALVDLEAALAARALEFDDVVKSGRTHLMDATPIRLGQELAGYAAQIRHAIRRVGQASDDMAELPLGGTAVGTGVATHPAFAARTIAALSEALGIPFVEATDHVERQATRDTVVFAHGALVTLAVSLTKITTDLRLMGSGPRAGLGEITLAALQPGSSVMPGKVNPVIPEAVAMVAAQVMGNQATVTVCGASGQLELNVMMPLMAHALLQSITILATGCRALAGCVRGLSANRDRARDLVARNLSLGTALAPVIGYDAAADLAREALRTDRTVAEVARERAVLPGAVLDHLLDPVALTRPGRPEDLALDVPGPAGSGSDQPGDATPAGQETPSAQGPRMTPRP